MAVALGMAKQSLAFGHSTGLATVNSSGGPVAAAVASVKQSYTGLIKTVDLKDRTLAMQGLDKKISLGNPCSITLPDKSTGTINDLQPGEKVTVNYHDADGIQVADRINIEQLAINGGRGIARAPMEHGMRAESWQTATKVNL
jgi:hypothetical protein